MKKYCPRTAAKRQVFPQVNHGLSRKLFPKIARTKITGILTERNHVNALTALAKWLFRESGKHLKNLCIREAKQYLMKRSSEVRQKTLDLDRQVINMHFCLGKKMDYVLSNVVTPRINRAYTPLQLEYLLSRAPAGLRLSIQLAVDAGLRSMELVTIGRVEELPPSCRDWHVGKFSVREGDSQFCVHGKGGLVREVRLNALLADALTIHERPVVTRITHCGAHLKSHFDLVGGNTFCRKFGRLSQKHLGFSHGAHGLRYMFAQARFLGLICSGHLPAEALKILAQEMGHFSTSNTLVYLHSRFDSVDRIVRKPDATRSS